MSTKEITIKPTEKLKKKKDETVDVTETEEMAEPVEVKEKEAEPVKEDSQALIAEAMSLLVNHQIEASNIAKNTVRKDSSKSGVGISDSYAKVLKEDEVVDYTIAAIYRDFIGSPYNFSFNGKIYSIVVDGVTVNRVPEHIKNYIESVVLRRLSVIQSSGSEITEKEF